MEKIDETVTLVKSVKYGNLVEIIEDAEAKVEEKDNYTSSTWEAFEATLQNAQKIAEESNINEEIVTDAYGNLKAAIDQLVLRGDVSELENEIILAEKLVENAVIGTEEGQYPEEAKEGLLVAINTAKEACYSDNSSQAVIDEALTTLKTEIATFESKVIVKNSSTDTNNGNNDNYNNGSGNTNNGSSNNTSTPTKKPNTAVKTGDLSNVLVYSILSLAVVGLVALGLKKRKSIVK